MLAIFIDYTHSDQLFKTFKMMPLAEHKGLNVTMLMEIRIIIPGILGQLSYCHTFLPKRYSGTF